MAVARPKISIVMPLYNKEREVGRAVKSVLDQNFSDFELFIINDGSTDGGPQVVHQIHDKRIFISDQDKGGVSAARNRGIEEAKSDLIAFLDADDEWKPDFLEQVIRLRSTFPSCHVFATKYLYCSRDGKTRLPTLRGMPEGLWEGVLIDYFAIASKSDPPLCTSAVAVTKTAITSVRGFPVGITSGEDLLTWARLALKYSIAYSAEPCSCFWLPNDVSERPGRTPQIPDVVGSELAKLLDENSLGSKKGLAEYISLWHKMRAVIFISLGENEKALLEIKKAASYSGMDLRLRLLRTLAYTPRNLSKALIKKLKRKS
jgi:glycosyltransferase involved in cell wall biosynthesis